MSLVVFYDPVFLEHKVPYWHPESPERLLAIEPVLRQYNLRPAIPLEERLLELAHTPAHIALVKNTPRQGFTALDPDTYLSPRSYEVALLAVGTCAEAGRVVVRGEAEAVFCAVRPPGHHSTSDHPMGFCLFNNVAVAIQCIRQEFPIDRVAIVDWDAHHGNGSQDIFYDEPSVLYISLHRYPFYPGTGHSSETGSSNIANYCLPGSTTREEYLATFRQAIEDKLEPFEPQLIFISAGFDALGDDPVAGLGLLPEDYAELTHILLSSARRPSIGVVSVLEGGYNLDLLPLAVEHHLRALSGP